ncbi:hypothetical protein [Thermaerobacter litoralis]
MANTLYLKRVVEDVVRQHLAQQFGVPFKSRVLKLVAGGTHEFDAVSDDGRVVASIKSASGKTSGGKKPAGKINAAVAELYYLTLIDAPIRILVLTSEEFFGIMEKHLRGRLAPGISLMYVPLPNDVRQRMTEIQALASQEVQPVRQLDGMS